MKSPIYVFGHKNPDTDSICSTLAYVELKRRLGIENVIACRLGKINMETRFVLDYFGVEEPILIDNMHMKLRDLDLHHPVELGADEPLKKAWDTLRGNESGSKLLPVLGEHGRLTGILSLADITRIFMEPYDEEMLHKYEISFDNLLNILQGKLVHGNYAYDNLCGSIFIGSMSDNDGYVCDKDVLITGKVETARQYANERDIGCVILTGDYYPVELDKARSAVICVKHSLLKTVSMINQAISVRSVMKTGYFEMFSTETELDDITEIMKTSSHRNFPVVDKTGRLFGIISRRHVLDYDRKKVILIDHNEATQSVDGLEQAQIIEIIDHHRIANVETQSPLYIRAEPVGCSATIVYGLYKERGVVPDKKYAGIMLSAILSDTLMFRSPTCTPRDKVAAAELAALAEQDIEKYGSQMFLAGTKLADYTPEEILSIDRKQFSIGTYIVYISQVNTLDIETAMAQQDELVRVMEEFVTGSGCDLCLLMVTDLFKGGSELLVAGRHRELTINAFGMALDSNHIYLEDVVSRKGQIVPRLTMASNGL
ncbi:MAG: putative manganese-dependent inorganic diphosphatase [Defluviitaleaceae bacterium]|nr:putative manganese-dependent inorganic diphosphatase [Defluviitaleaceae bacterium]